MRLFDVEVIKGVRLYLPYISPISPYISLLDVEVIKGVRCAYRLCHEGLPHVLPHLGRQRAPCAASSLLRLMQR